MVSLSRLFHKTDEREKTATAATAPTEPACAPTAEAPAAPVHEKCEGVVRYHVQAAHEVVKVRVQKCS